MKQQNKWDDTKQRLNAPAWHPIDVTEVRFINKTTGEQHNVFSFITKTQVKCILQQIETMNDCTYVKYIDIDE